MNLELDGIVRNDARKIAASPELDKQYVDHLKKVNDIFYDQIKIADQKAAYIFTFLLAFIVTSPDGRAAYSLKRYLSGDPVLTLLSAMLAISLLVAILSAIMVVMPRSRAATGTSLYWGTWRVNRERFTAARAHGDGDYLFDEYLGNVENLSLINRDKYRFVSYAMRGLIAAVIAYVLILAWTGGAGLS